MRDVAHVDRDDRHFERWSRTYDRSLAQPLLFGPVQGSVVDAIARRAPAAPAAVLDIGCGTARLLDRLGQIWPDTVLVGLDRAAGMLIAARRLRPRLRTARGTAEALPWRDGSFDFVISTLSFHHWADQEVGLAEVARVLRPGGMFALADASVDDLPRYADKLSRLVRRLTPGGHAEHPHGRLLALADRRRLLEGAGLRILDERGALCGRWVPMTVAERLPGRSPERV